MVGCRPDLLILVHLGRRVESLDSTVSDRRAVAGRVVVIAGAPSGIAESDELPDGVIAVIERTGQRRHGGPTAQSVVRVIEPRLNAVQRAVVPNAGNPVFEVVGIEGVCPVPLVLSGEVP